MPYGCRKLKALQSLEVCGGGVTDTGVAYLQDLSQLRSLSLAQVTMVVVASGSIGSIGSIASFDPGTKAKLVVGVSVGCATSCPAGPSTAVMDLLIRLRGSSALLLPRADASTPVAKLSRRNMCDWVVAAPKAEEETGSTFCSTHAQTLTAACVGGGEDCHPTRACWFPLHRHLPVTDTAFLYHPRRTAGWATGRCATWGACPTC